MNVYKQNNRPNWYFAIMLNNERGRGQKVVNTLARDKRVAVEVMRKTRLLAESVEAGMPLTAELRRWLNQMHPTLRRRLATIGLLEDQVDATVRSVREHADDYLKSCRFEGMGLDYEKVKRSQLERAIRETKAKRLTDLNLERVSAFLHSLREQGRSPRTINQNRATLIAFLNWCVNHDRLPSHRLDRIPRLDEEADRRLVRRAATDDELDRFLAAAPEKRRLIYQAALLTGLRRKELSRIEKRDVDLANGTLMVRAEVSKTNKAQVLPLHEQLRGPLLKRIKRLRPHDTIFNPIPRMKTYRRDLKRAGISYIDAQGRQLDFHALRGTFATRLLRQGIPPSIARRLTRHKSVKTLEKHYDKLGFDDADAAMKQLPGLKSKQPQRK